MKEHDKTIESYPFPVGIGDLCWTPFEPRGIVRVTWIEGETARGFFVGDHPKGYLAGSVAAYPIKELTPIRDISTALGHLSFLLMMAEKGEPPFIPTLPQTKGA